MGRSRRPYRSALPKSFAQRRQQIVANRVQLSTGVDVYNDKRNPTDPIQIPLDLTLDIIELTQAPGPAPPERRAPEYPPWPRAP